MCDFSKGFILCKCSNPKVIVHNKKSRRHKNKKQPIEYHWTLYKFIGMSQEKELGRYTLPVNNIDNGLTSDFVINELNNRNCFDFEYEPSEGDNLIISKADSFYRIEFIFRDGKWLEEHYSPFDHIYEKFDNGKLTTAE